MADQVGMQVILEWHRLLQRVADKLCNCRAQGNRPVDPDDHSNDCEYRITVNANG